MLIVNLTSVCEGSSSQSAKKYQSVKLTNRKFKLVFQKLVMQSSKQYNDKETRGKTKTTAAGKNNNYSYLLPRSGTLWQLCVEL